MHRFAGGITAAGRVDGRRSALDIIYKFLELFFFSSRRRHTISGLGIPAEPLFRSTLFPYTPTAISIFVCLSMVQLMAVFISMRCTLCGHFLQVALTLILVVGYAIAAS